MKRVEALVAAGLLCLPALLVVPGRSGAVLAAGLEKGTGRILSEPPAKPVAGLVVIGEVRPRDMEPSACADRVAAQVRRLLDAGVPAKRITVVGASMGGYIAMLVSDRLAVGEIGYVFMGSCDDETLKLGDGLHGEVLSIFEASDELEQSCAPLFARARGVGRHAELRLETGLHHGFLYRALPGWIGPVVRWARERRA